MAVVIGVLRETAANETRVPVVPKSAIAAATQVGGCVATDDSMQRQLLSAASTSSSIFFASPNSIRLFSL
jgi:hypothetical protein